MSQTIQHRGDTAANWTAANPVLAQREMGIETDTMLYKFGNGVTAWNSLPYMQLTGEFASAILMDAVANPTAPAAGKMLLYAHSVAGRIVPKFIGPSGLDNLVQSELAANSVQMASPGLTTALTYIGMGALTIVGTNATPAITTGINLRSSMRRVTVTSAATANSASEIRNTLAMCYRGEVFGSAIAGGFYFKTRWGMSTTTALQRTAVGLWPGLTATATTQNPSALTNCIFAGSDSADTNLQIMHNDGSGTCNKIDLGAGFPANNVNAVYELALFSPPNADAVGWRVVRLDTGAVASGTITTDLPTKTALLTYHAYANNGGTAAAVVLEFMRMYLETDY